jgi:hypothetical protein
VWFSEPISSDEVTFDADVYLLKKDRAKALRGGTPITEVLSKPGTSSQQVLQSAELETIAVSPAAKTIILAGTIPPELWNKVGIHLIPKLRSSAQLTLGVNFAVEVGSGQAANVVREIGQALADLELTGKIKIEVK